MVEGAPRSQAMPASTWLTKLREKHSPWHVRDVLTGTEFETHAKKFVLGLFVVHKALDMDNAKKWGLRLEGHDRGGVSGGAL